MRKNVSAKRPKLDVESWARGQSAAKGGRLCSLCSAPSDIQDIVKRVAQMRASGESQASQKQLIDLLESEFGIAYSKTTISNHISMHLKINWGGDGR